MKKQENKVQPNKKQKEVFRKVINEGKAVSAAMVEVGYSKATAVNPSNITNSKGWKMLMDQYIPDKTLAKTHSKLLKDKKPEIRVKALDLGYKLKGSYAAEKSQSVNLNINTEAKDLEGYNELKEEFEEKLRQKLLNQ